ASPGKGAGGPDTGGRLLPLGRPPRPVAGPGRGSAGTLAPDPGALGSALATKPTPRPSAWPTGAPFRAAPAQPGVGVDWAAGSADGGADPAGAVSWDGPAGG